MNLELPAVFSRYRQIIEMSLQDALPQGSPDLLYRMMRYHMGWVDREGAPAGGLSGKAIRPALCLLACDAVGRDPKVALPGAVALELVHNFSLIHDDIQDGDRERHHRPTVWSLWGMPQAINAGDSMLTMAHLALARLADSGLDSARVIAAFRTLDEGCLRMIEGQCLDLSFEDRLEISVETYMEMISRKTGALFETSLRLGSLAGGADDDLVERFGRIGYHLGHVFQVRDDILGIWGSRAFTGKPEISDIKRKKKSLPVVYAFSVAQGDVRRRLVDIYSAETIDDATAIEVTGYLDELRAYEFCQKVVEEEAQQAISEVDAAAPRIRPTFRGELQEICNFLAGRQF